MPDRRVQWSDAARDDLRAIAFHIAQDSVDSAVAVAERLEHRAAALRTLASRGRVVPELRRMDDGRFRELIEAPWRIIYLPEARAVSIVAIVDSRRDLREWLREQAVRLAMARS